MRVSGQLRLGIRQPRFSEDSFAIDFMTDSAEQNRIRGFALFERAFRPFDFMFGVIMSTAFDLFDFEVDLE